MFLYEILATDKVNLIIKLKNISQVKVIQSYLKGENNQPKQKVLKVNITLNSIFIILTEISKKK